MSVIKPFNCTSLCRLIMVISGAGSDIPNIAIIQSEPKTEPISNMITAVITNGLLGLKALLEAKYL